MKILKGIINVLTTLIIVVGGVFLALYFCGIVPYIVLSGSMEPTIETGSLCFINKHSDFKSIQKDDIIAFRLNDGTLVTHRAVLINDLGIMTKGDNNKENDTSYVTNNNYVGKNIFWIPKIGYTVMAFQSPKGRIIIISAVVVLLVAGMLFGEDDKKKKKEIKENNS